MEKTKASKEARQEGGEKAPARRAKGEHSAEDGGREDGRKLADAKERIGGVMGEHRERSRLHRARDGHRTAHDQDPSVELPARERHGEQREAEEQESKRTEADRQRRANRSDPGTSKLERAERAQQARNPDRERVGAGEDRSRCGDGEDQRWPVGVAAPLLPRDRREERRRQDDCSHREPDVADDAREEVVEEAVRRDGVMAREPEVVPDEDVVPYEIRAIKVRRRVSPCRAQRGQPDSDQGGETGRSCLRSEGEPA